MLRPSLLPLALVCALATPAAAQDAVHAFVYGNEMLRPASGEVTSVPEWLALLAGAAGHDFALSGTTGTLTDFARDLPPSSKWRFEGVTPAWDTDRFAFRRAGFDTVLIAPQTGLQDRPAAESYAGSGASPISDTLRVIDWTSHQAPGARFWVYEGWAAAGTAEEAFAAASHHDWYRGYVEAIATARPGIDVALIPTARTIEAVLSRAPLEQLSDGALFDAAQQPTDSLYFLAALVTYATLYAEAPPEGVTLPDTIAPLIRDNYAEVAAQIWAIGSGAVLPDTGPALPVMALTADTGLADPSLAMGLNGIADWSTQQPFLDVMKTARPWVGHLPGEWGAWDMAELTAAGHIGPDGWPLSLPDEVEAIEAFILTDQPTAATSLAGRYILTWEGQGDILVLGRASNVDIEDDHITFDYAPGEGLVAIRIEAVDAADPIRDIRVVREDRLPLLEAGAIFNPDWLALVADLRSVRFMDWMLTNHSGQVTWDDRPRVGDFSYMWRGVPVEVMVSLANTIGADPWFTLPHRADDAYVRQFATIVRDTVDPRLHVHAEWSNEVWNFIFTQAIWAGEQATARWGDAAGGDAWMQFAGLRAAQVADIWAEVFAGDPDRLVRVVGVHTGWLGLEEPLLEAPLAVAEGRARPADSFDAYAVTGYFGYEIGEDDRAGTILEWIDAGTATEQVTAALREGSVAELTGVIWPHHAAVAEDYGLRLIMYEGGTHVAGHGAQIQDQRLTDFYTAYNYSPEVAAIYAELMTGWQAAGGTMFNAFVDVSAPTQWGSWGALRHLGDSNPRWATLMAFNARPSGERRAPGTFLHGVHLTGTDASDDLTGTAEEDVILAGGGDDILRPGDGADILHGQGGTDRLILPGSAEDYAQGWDGATLVLIGPDGALTRATSVEELVFEDIPDDVHSLVMPEPIQ